MIRKGKGWKREGSKGKKKLMERDGRERLRKGKETKGKGWNGKEGENEGREKEGK